MKTWIGLTLIAAQAVMIVVARFHPMCYYCWAPYDSQNQYVIHATINGQDLTREQVKNRYQLNTPGINSRAIYQVTDVIANVERLYGKTDTADVTVNYRTNGGREQSWRLATH